MDMSQVLLREQNADTREAASAPAAVEETPAVAEPVPEAQEPVVEEAAPAVSHTLHTHAGENYI